MSNITKTEKLIKALHQKGPMTEAAIRNRLGIPNPRASVWYARTQGYNIVTDETGQVTKYAIG
jgi:hypothetical protein